MSVARAHRGGVQNVHSLERTLGARAQWLTPRQPSVCLLPELTRRWAASPEARDEFLVEWTQDPANLFTFAFDLLAVGDEDLRGEPFQSRRARLEQVFTQAQPPLQLAPSTSDRDEALLWMEPDLATIGIERVVAKDASKPYRAGRTGDWRKIRSGGVMATC